MKNIQLIILIILVSGCMKTQKSTISVDYMDPEVKATDDFFLFSNGQWIKNNEIPASESRWGSFNELDRANKDKITTILLECEKDALNSPAGSDNQLLGDFYHSFLDMEGRNSKGHSQIELQLNKINELSTNQELVATIANLHNQGVGGLFGIYVGQDMKDVETNQYHMYQSGIGLPNMEYYSSENKKDILTEYEKYVEKSHLTIFNKTDQAKAFAKNIMRFETALASKMFKPAEMRIPENTYNKRSKKEISAMLHPFDFNLYVEKRGITSFDTAIVGTIQFMENIPTMMNEFNLE